MTPTEIIEIVDRITPNAHTDADKLRWLRELDETILAELNLLRRRLNMPPRQMREASDGDPTGLALAVKAPFDEDLYVSFLQACMAWADEEDARYDRFITRFNNAYDRYMSYEIQVSCALSYAHYRF